MKDSTILGMAFFGGIIIVAVFGSGIEYLRYQKHLKQLSDKTKQ